jgi:hypothetical protein
MYRHELGNQKLFAGQIPVPVSIDHQTYQVYEAKTHVFTARHSLGANESVTYLMSIPEGVYPHVKFSIKSYGNTLLDVYKNCTTSDDGAAVSNVYNCNFAASSRNSSSVAFYHQPTISASTRVYNGMSMLGVASNADLPESFEVIGDQSTKMAFTITSDASSNKIVLTVLWSESGDEFEGSSESSSSESASVSSSTPSSDSSESSTGSSQTGVSSASSVSASSVSASSASSNSSSSNSSSSGSSQTDVSSASTASTASVSSASSNSSSSSSSSS